MGQDANKQSYESVERHHLCCSQHNYFHLRVCTHGFVIISDQREAEVMLHAERQIIVMAQCFGALVIYILWLFRHGWSENDFRIHGREFSYFPDNQNLVLKVHPWQ